MDFNISIFRLLIDFGLLVLIWLVQLVIYPGFGYYKKENLIGWHQKYTLKITYVVMPLMVVQLVLSIVQLATKTSFYSMGSVLLITAVWILTFTQFVPLHNKISTGKVSPETTSKLVAKNWFRTGLWTIIFVWSATKVFLPSL